VPGRHRDLPHEPGRRAGRRPAVPDHGGRGRWPRCPGERAGAQAFFEATGGGAIRAAQIDENNDYNVLANGGTYVDPTYIAAGG
jgi:hypothetical protein